MRARLVRISTDLRAQRYGVVLGAIAVLFALGVPAYAVEGASSAASSVANALKIAKKADKRSKQALSLAQKVGAKGGQQGPAGPQGAAGQQGNQGLQGEPGTDGSPDTGPQILSKLVAVDGEASDLDSDQLDGLDSTAFHQGGGQTKSGSIAFTLGDGVAGANTIVSITDFVRASVSCSAQTTDSVRVRVFNDAAVTMDAYMDEGAANASFAQIPASASPLAATILTSPTPAADLVTWQVNAGGRRATVTTSARFVSNGDGSVTCSAESQITEA